METIIMNDVTLVLTHETARSLRAEIAEIEEEREAEQSRERDERKAHWILWHWHARRWAMYGNKFDCDGDYFSDMYKDEHGIRPRFSREDIFWILYERENWIQHGKHETYDPFEPTAEDYAEWAAASCGETYNSYVGRPWLD